MNTGEKISLYDIFKTKGFLVQIPIIQRDYAQGRNNKKNLRNDFLNYIFNSLDKNIQIDLDFVYGHFESSKFIPLDGQQRLTTLFLLHYYLAIKDGEFESFQEIFKQNNNSKFTYKTRHSSRSFFDNLVVNGVLEIESDDNISKQIKDQKWYFYEWENDTTIQGCLTMLDAIEEKFKKTSGFYNKLIHNNLVCFEFLNLNEYNLSDDLYIKMNSRGKPLTPFENFKAKFEGIVREVDTRLAEIFTNSVDTTWCDLFWNLSKKHTPTKPAVDQLFLNYFSFITEFLFYKDEEISTDYVYNFNNFEIIRHIYSSNDNLSFLIKSLNLFANSSDDIDNINSFFESIFTKDIDKNKVNLFENDINLLNKLLFNFSSITHLNRFLLYAIIGYHLKLDHKKLVFSNSIIDLVRFVRNFILDINQKGNDSSKDDVVANIRFSNYPEIVNFIDKLICDEPFTNFIKNVENSKYRKEFVVREIEKVDYINSNPQNREAIIQLENHPNLKGNLSSFDLVLKSNLDINKVVLHFIEIWKSFKTKEIIRCLLTYGDYSIYVGQSYFGGLWYFGNKNKWERIFNFPNKNLPNILLNLFTDIEKFKLNSINDLINKINDIHIDEEWRELFVKYPETLISDTNIYSYRENNYYKIDALKNYTLRGYHINSFVNAVLNDENLKCRDKIKNTGWEVDTYESTISLKHSAYMSPANEGWYISHNKTEIVNALNGLNYKELEDNSLILLPSEQRDFIESAILFLNNYYS